MGLIYGQPTESQRRGLAWLAGCIFGVVVTTAFFVYPDTTGAVIGVVGGAALGWAVTEGVKRAWRKRRQRKARYKEAERVADEALRKVYGLSMASSPPLPPPTPEEIAATIASITRTKADEPWTYDPYRDGPPTEETARREAESRLHEHDGRWCGDIHEAQGGQP